MLEEKIFKAMRYVERKPANFDENEKYPVLIYLHGAGTRGGDINHLKQNFIFGVLDKFTDFPFVVIAPLCEGSTWFDYGETLREFSRFIQTVSYCDETRIYLAGNSMGGFGTWALALSIPEVFAAAVPICGGGTYWDAGRLCNVPIWAFHGGKDDIVPLDESVRMVNAVNKWGGNARLTVYENNGHDAWTDTFSNPELYKWLLSNTKQSAKIKSFENDQKKYG
ncbi:MAG: prolyl oligopeptidase family serine peptidase [Clostridiales bacterium]|nr:prolyl oligopeptidase family serine peptidase [Candidatus Equinaster intestinalis]